MPDIHESQSPTITVRETVNEDHPEYGTSYRIETPGGHINGSYNKQIFTIHNFEVEPQMRRRGLGKALLTAAKVEAEKLQAKGVHATIVSREAYDAAKSVFGEDALIVNSLGNYRMEPKRLLHRRPKVYVGANATLWYKLSKSEDSL